MLWTDIGFCLFGMILNEMLNVPVMRVFEDIIMVILY